MNAMKFREEIAAIQAGMARCDANETGTAFAPSATSLREGRRMFNTLAAQFHTHIGSSVICLPMGDVQRDGVPDAHID